MKSPNLATDMLIYAAATMRVELYGPLEAI